MQSKVHRRHAKLMGSAFEFVVIDGRGDEMIDLAIGEIGRIETLLTEFSTTSVTAQLNQYAGQSPVRVPFEVYALLTRCKELSSLTQGAFDITAALLKKLYNFKGEQVLWPDASTIQETKRCSGWEKIKLLDNNQVMLATAGMHINFAAIGKGYAADCAKRLLVARGVPAGVISASGDLTAWGTTEGGQPWKIGIADPKNPDHPLFWLPVKNASVATSGDYEQYFMRDGHRYSHTIDPKTGLPVKNMKSVTVVSPSAELSDALATAVFVMGHRVGLHLIEQMPDTHALVIDSEDCIHTSRQLNIHQYASELS